MRLWNPVQNTIICLLSVKRFRKTTVKNKYISQFIYKLNQDFNSGIQTIPEYGKEIIIFISRIYPIFNPESASSAGKIMNIKLSKCTERLTIGSLCSNFFCSGQGWCFFLWCCRWDNLDSEEDSKGFSCYQTRGYVSWFLASLV